MNDGTFRGRWKREVFRSPHVSAEVKVFLLFVEHYYMEPDGHVCEPRKDIADTFECHPRKVTAKFQAAIQGGLMRQTVRGQKGRTAEYQAVVPGLSQGASARHPESPSGPVQGAADYHPERSPQGAADYHPETAQGADRGHPETGSGCQHPAPSLKARTDLSDHGDGAIVVRLFDEEENSTTSLRSQTAERSSAARVPARVEDDAFAEFWAAYPRRVGKGAARKAWAKAIKNGADPKEVIWGARRYSTDPRRAQADIKYTAHPATWLNAERWSDEDQPAQPVEATGTRRARQAIEAGRQLQDMLDRGEIQL